MSDLIEFVTQACKRELLAQDGQWQALHRQKEIQLAAAREACGRGALSSGQLIDTVDAESRLAAYESDACFALGIQLGLELGGLRMLPNCGEEP